MRAGACSVRVTHLHAPPSRNSELMAGNSVLPTLLCTFWFPWYALARTAGSQQIVDPNIAIGVGLLVEVVSIGVGFISESLSMTGIIIGTILQVSYLITISVGTFVIRRRLRRKHGIQSSAALDCIYSLYPCNVREA